jgi:hypothetical protein
MPRFHGYLSFTLSTQYLSLQIQALSRDLPDHNRWFINRHITEIPLTGT